MKLLVSNYGGTLKTNIKTLKLNIGLIRNFMAKGNYFCLATGRSYMSIKREICIHNIPYDYLICNSGAVIMNRCDKIVEAKYIDPQVVQLIQDVAIKHGYEISCFNPCGQPASLDDTLDIDIHTRNVFRNIKMEKEILSFCDDIKLDHKLEHLFVRRNTNKAEAINTLIQKENLGILESDITAIGDSNNDIEMLKLFNGYKMALSCPLLYGKGIDTCYQVKNLVKKITN